MTDMRQTGVDWIERSAVLASAVCLVHCLALPLVFAAIPVLATIIAVPESIHLLLLMLALPLSGGALVAGWTRHGLCLPACLGGTGLALMALALTLPAGLPETMATVAGSMLLVSAHAWNWRLRSARKTV